MSLREILHMVLILTLFTGVWGGLLSLVKIATEDQIEYQRIKNVKAPALEKAFSEEYTNDPVKERREIVVGRDASGDPIKRNVFIAKNDGQIVSVAFEGYGSGYGGDLGVMVAIDPREDMVEGVAVTTHSETPGVGTDPMKDKSFMGQFSGKELSTNFGPGGRMDTYSGATYTSTGIMEGVQSAVQLYSRIKDKIL